VRLKNLADGKEELIDMEKIVEAVGGGVRNL
jgi:hypothetical protein